MKAIPTRYRNTQFRSRLEARWAHYFDQLRWRWEYEPFDMDGYIPDFLIFGVMPLLVEVKPISTYAEAEKIADGLPFHDEYEQIVVGVAPNLTGESNHGGEIAACLREHGYDPDEDGVRFWSQPASFVWCVGKCDDGSPACRSGSYGLVPDYGSYRYRPCGHYHGGGPNFTGKHWAPYDYLPDWAETRNATQWRPA